MKSIYLNNSKYSNNLRHSLRIFFEREVKTKHTPTLLGSTFKGSKWVDYQTFNINRLFIKSGLSYFYYIFIFISIFFVFLGRSKAEQYFGFLPFFTYINFILGYVPLVVSDATSQLILSVYVSYIFLLKYFYKLTNLLTNNLIDSIEVHNSRSTGFNADKSKLNVSDLFVNKNIFRTNTPTSLLSKTLTITQSKLS